MLLQGCREETTQRRSAHSIQVFYACIYVSRNFESEHMAELFVMRNFYLTVNKAMWFDWAVNMELLVQIHWLNETWRVRRRRLPGKQKHREWAGEREVRNYQRVKRFPGGSDGEESTCNEGEPGAVLGPGRPPGEGNGYHSCSADWETPWTEEPGGLQSIDSQQVRHSGSDLAHSTCSTSGTTACGTWTGVSKGSVQKTSGVYIQGIQRDRMNQDAPFKELTCGFSHQMTQCKSFSLKSI